MTQPADAASWRPRLREALRGRPTSVFVFDDGQGPTLPAASVWTGSRLWVDAFREAGLKPGDRLALALPPSPAFLHVLVAALWEGLTLAPATPGATDPCERVDPRLLVTASPTSEHEVAPAPDGGPATPITLRNARHDPTPDARLLLRTGGTTGRGKLVALSDDNVLSNVDAHVPHLGLDAAVVASVLPWHHAFGLVLELLPALLGDVIVVRSNDDGREASRLLGMLRRWDATHLNAVPLTFRRLLDQPGGRETITGLRGGIVGGAPVRGDLIDALAETNLRVGYGQTEASPGICLGEPGEFAPGFIGRPLACRTFIDADGHLRFSGPNACLGTFDADAGLVRLDADRWHDTGDLVREGRDGLVFLGRADHAFKLDNGRLVDAAAIEAELRDAWQLDGDVVVVTPDGSAICVAFELRDVDELPPTHVVRNVLGGLASRLDRVVALPAGCRTPKGDVDRRALVTQLAASRSIKLAA